MTATDPAAVRREEMDLAKLHAMLENHNDAMRARDELLARAERELACRDALIQDHLAKIMHLENRVDAEAHRAERAEAARDAAQAVLKSIEWAAVGYVGYYVPCQACPSCRGKTGYANCYYSEPLGHAPDCVLAAALGSVTLPATPIASGHAGERETIRAAEIEATAKKIYEGFAFLPGYVPWTVRGNSEKQEEARHLARRALATRDTGSAP